MIDRQQLESILQRRFPGAALEQIAAAANAILSVEGAEQRAKDAGATGGPDTTRQSLRMRKPDMLAPALPQDRPS